MPSRPSTRAYLRAIVRTSSSSAGPTVDDQAAAASTASKSAAASSSDAAASNPSVWARPDAVAGKGVLLEGTARVRTGLTWFKPTHVQLLAAPALEGMPDAPAWSALVVDGVPLPYEEVAWVRMDEGALEFGVEHKPSSTAAQIPPPRLHLRVDTRSDFNLWREALGPIIANTTLLSSASTSVGSKPSAVHAAQKWLAHAEDGAARCSYSSLLHGRSAGRL